MDTLLTILKIIVFAYFAILFILVSIVIGVDSCRVLIRNRQYRHLHPHQRQQRIRSFSSQSQLSQQSQEYQEYQESSDNVLSGRLQHDILEALANADKPQG